MATKFTDQERDDLVDRLNVAYDALKDAVQEANDDIDRIIRDLRQGAMQEYNELVDEASALLDNHIDAIQQDLDQLEAGDSRVNGLTDLLDNLKSCSLDEVDIPENEENIIEIDDMSEAAFNLGDLSLTADEEE